ncbi:hypothetical protein [Streptomyces herbicida]|uniref:hypothetical protein n=1 Tax=Streptomyces herbicida TaxID=3065675 RepID=UPI00292D1150|nr:hypothetical protein [Streptomyces sp. NEAU-HV9]
MANDDAVETDQAVGGLPGGEREKPRDQFWGARPAGEEESVGLEAAEGDPTDGQGLLESGQNSSGEQRAESGRGPEEAYAPVVERQVEPRAAVTTIRPMTLPSVRPLPIPSAVRGRTSG